MQEAVMVRTPWWRGVEFALFYLATPVVIAVLMPPGWLFPMLFAFTLVGLVLLHLTPGFHWHELIRGAGQIRWRAVLTVAAVTALIGLGVMLTTRPEALFGLVRARPGLLLMIALLYPVLSALPQEIVFRALYFRRYGGLMPHGAGGVVVNAALFSLAHLMYWSWVVAVMTFAGGLVFAWAYEVKRNFPMAVVMHALAGVILFAFGMGVYFYSGNAVRPF